MAKKNFIQFLSDTERYDELDTLTSLVKDYYSSDENDNFSTDEIESDFNNHIIELFEKMDEKYSTPDNN